MYFIIKKALFRKKDCSQVVADMRSQCRKREQEAVGRRFLERKRKLRGGETGFLTRGSQNRKVPH